MANKLWEKKLALAQASLGVSADEMSDPFYRSHVEKVASLYPDTDFEARDPTAPDTPAKEANKHVAGWLTSDWLPEAGKAGVGMLDMVANVATAAGDYAGSDVLKNAGRSTSRVLGRYTDIYSDMQSKEFKQRLESEDINATKVGSTILHAIPQIPLFLAGGWAIGGLGAAAKLGTIATGAGKATQVMARLAGKGAAQATAMGARVNTGARLVGTYGATNTIIGAADTHREAYDQAMQIIDASPDAKGFTSAEKENIAASLAREAANRQMPVAFITGALGLGGAVGAVKAAAGKGSILKAMAKGAAIDAIPGAAEEGAQGYNVNVTLKQIDPSLDPFKGVATRAMLGAIAGGVLGGGMAGVEDVNAKADRADRLVQAKADRATRRERSMYSRQLAAELDAATNVTLEQVVAGQTIPGQPPAGPGAAPAAAPVGGQPPPTGGTGGLMAPATPPAQDAGAGETQSLIPPLPGRPEENEQAWGDYLLLSTMVSDAEKYLNEHHPDWSNPQIIDDALDEDVLSDTHLNLEAAAGNKQAEKTLLVRRYFERKAAMKAAQEIAERMDESFMTTRPSDIDAANIPTLMDAIPEPGTGMMSPPVSDTPFFNESTDADTRLIPGLWGEDGKPLPPGKNVPILMDQVQDDASADKIPTLTDELPSGLMAPGAEDPGDLYRNSKKITKKPTSPAVLAAQRIAGKRMQSQYRNKATWDDIDESELNAIDDEIDSLTDGQLIDEVADIESPFNSILNVVDQAAAAASNRSLEVVNDESIDSETQEQLASELDDVQARMRAMKKRLFMRKKEARAIRDGNKGKPDKKDGEPSDAQKEAGNYKKEHIRMHGLDIAIENPRGSVRRGKDENGKEWEHELAHDYGYIKRTEGNDGDHVDVFIGPNLTSNKIYVVNQTYKNGKFDEHKVMFGFSNEKSALDGYLANYDEGWDNIDGIVQMSVDQFKSWLEDGSQKKAVRDGWKPDAKPGEWETIREDLEMEHFFTGEGASKFMGRVERGGGKYNPSFSIPGYRENQWFPGTFDEANDINVPEFDTAEEARAFVESVEKAFRSGGNKAVDAVLAKEKSEKPSRPPADAIGKTKGEKNPKKDKPVVPENTLVTEDAAEAARARIKAKLGRLNAGIDPELLKDGVTIAAYHVERGARTFVAYAKAMISDFGEGIRPYLKSWYMALKYDPAYPGLELDGAAAVDAANVDEITAEEEAANETETASLAGHFKVKIDAGEMPKDNPALKKLVAEFDGSEPDGFRMKEAQEDLETAIAMKAREIVAEGRSEGDTFMRLVSLYGSQPNLNARTSTSVENQAYSTPAPLAYLAGLEAGITKNSTVYEPTAGNGMLLITATPENVKANEIEKRRLASLRSQGFDVSDVDATQAIGNVIEEGEVDVVITNPPFGGLKDGNGKPIKIEIDGYTIGKIDHQIVAESLRAMSDGGGATLIIAADKVTGNISPEDRVFFNWLYGNYNVVGHYEVDGKLYSRQGASWPVRVITINGRKKSGRVSPRNDTIVRASTWEQVYEQHKLVGSVVGEETGAGDGAGDTDAGVEGAKPPRSPGSPGKSGSGSGGRGGRGGSSGGRGNAPGAGGKSAGDGRGAGVDGAPGGPVDGGLGGGETDTDNVGGPGSGNAPEPARAPVEKAESSDFQVPYIPQSSRKDEDVLVPINMAQPLKEALEAIDAEVGGIDKYLQRELQYDSIEEMHKALMGLQVDSVAAAIYQMKKGGSIVIADQTGIGKGRQAAAIIRWAKIQGKIPVFMTVKESLFSDMYRDLVGIGSEDTKPFIFNTDGSVITTDREGKEQELFKNQSSAKHSAAIDSITRSGSIPAGSDAIFLTYSQIQRTPSKRAALSAIASNSIIILDEAHTAAGDSSTGEFMRGIVEMAGGVTYLSATWAKRPDNIPLYYRTDLRIAGDQNSLIDAIKRGGPALQTVVSNMLTEAGQMFRRERSFKGISIKTVVDTNNRAAHEGIADTVTLGLREVLNADMVFNTTFMEQLSEQVAEEGETIIDGNGKTVNTTVESSTFASVTHNYISQMLLAIKVDTAAETAIKAIKEGRKPVIALQNTMESFLEEFIENNNLSEGDSLGDFDYRTVLSRALERTRRVTIKDPRGKKSIRVIELDELDPVTRAAYDKAQDLIDNLDIGDLPVSPIDMLRKKITDAGYSVKEISGRSKTVRYSDAGSFLSSRDKIEKTNSVRTVNEFNSGALGSNGKPLVDCLIINASGSTGISLHSSSDFADKKPRQMIVVQPSNDINIFMQTLGRINRTGQVNKPSYLLLTSDIPAETRPAAVLSKKMKLLNANTSSNTESETSIQVPDINNKYGDKIVKEYLDENMSLRLGLFGFKDIEEDGLAQKATGRLAIMSVETQRAFYDDVLPQYQQTIDYLDQTNQNDLVPKTVNFNAQVVNARQIFEGDEESDSPFAAPSVYNELLVDSQGKRMTLDEVSEAIQGSLEGKTAEESAREMIKDGDADFAAYYYKHYPNNEDGNAKSSEVMTSEINSWLSGRSPAENRDAIARAYIWRYKVGTAIRFELDGQAVNGIIIGVSSNHKKGVGSPYAPGKIVFTIALNSSMRKAPIPLSKLMYLEPQVLTGSTPANIFGSKAAPSKEIEKVITGNLISAYAQIVGTTRGSIINFTMADGTTVQGIRLPQDFDPKVQLRDDYKFKSAADVVQCLTNIRSDDMNRFGYQSGSASVRLLPVGPSHRPLEQIKIQVAKDKKKGGHIYLSQAIRAITGDFVKKDNFFIAYVNVKDAEAVVKIIMGTDPLYGQPSQIPGIRAELGEKEPEVIKNKPVGIEEVETAKPGQNAAQPSANETPANVLGFTPAVDKHSQTGVDIFTAKPTMRINEEQYARVKDIARDYGGYWNRFLKKFAFPTAQFRDSFIEEFAKQQRSGSVRFKLEKSVAKIADIPPQPPKKKVGMDRMVVEDMIARKLKGWKDAPLVEVIQNESDLPEAVLRDIEEKGYQGQVGGVFHGDRVYLVADNIKDEADLEDTFVHEAVGHLGMRKLMGKEYDQFLRNVLLSYAGTDTLKEIALGYKLNMDKQSGRMEAADELVAHLSETGDRPGLLKQLIAMFKNWLQSKGFNGSLTRFSDNDIRALIAAAERRMQHGKMGPSFSAGVGRVYSMDMHRLRQKHLEEVVTRTAAMWKAFGRHKWTAQYQVPQGRTLGEIAAQLDLGITVGPVSDKAMLRKAAPNETMLKVSIPGGGSAVVVTNLVSGEVYVDASLMSPGKGGGALYQMALSYAYNNGLVFIGDPKGVSPAAIIRRTEQMMSSAIKYGTTRHMRPAYEQIVAGHFSPGMNWKDGDHEHNLRELALVSYDNVTRHLPEIAHVYYDHISRNFVYRRPGARVLSAAAAAERAAGKDIGAGAGAAGAGSQRPAGADKGRSAGADADLDWLNSIPYGGVLTDSDLVRLGGIAGKRFRKTLNDSGKSTFGDENPIGRSTIARAALSNTALRSGSLADWRQVLAEIVSELNTPVESDAFSNLRYRKAVGEPVPNGQETTRFRLTKDKLFNPMSPKTFTMNEEALIDTIIRKVQDKYLRLKRVQAEMEAKWGEELPADLDAYRREELMHERTATMLRVLEEKHVKPLIELMGKQGITIGDLDAYLYAKHAFDRNAYIAQINPAMPDGGSGITNDIAQGWLDDLDAEGKLQKCEELAKRVYAMNEARLGIIESAGLEDPKVINNWRKSLGDYYVPLKGTAGDESQEFIRRVGSGLGVKGKESAAALGRRTIAESPLLNSIAQVEEAVVRAEKNRVAKSFAAMVRKFPDQNLWEIVTPASQQIRYLDTTTREVSWRNDYAIAHRHDIFSFKENGKEVLIRVKDPLLLQAMNNLGPEKLNGMMRFLGGINRKLAALNTSLNPEFVIGNFARDFQAALMALESESAKKGGLIHGQKIIAKTIASMAPAMQGIRIALRDPDNIASNKWAQDFDEMRQVGGTTGFFGLKGIDEKKSEIEAMLKEANGDWSKVPRKTFRTLRDLIYDYNSVVENAARLAAYVTARDTLLAAAEERAAASGSPVSAAQRRDIRERSASLAKNLTVNFNRQGEWGTAANSLYLFANASVQGTARFAQVMVSKRGAVIGTSLAVISLMLAEMNRILAGDDDDDRNFYDKVPDHIKERNLVLMDPFNPGEYMTFPLPYGYNIFNALGNAASDFINGKPTGKIATSLAGSFMGSFSPLGAESSDDFLTMGTKLISPTILDPAIQLVANENFFGEPIYNEGYKYSVERPASSLYWKSTGETAKFMASWLNEVSGGTPYRPGSIDISPDAMEHIFDFATGGAGAFVRRTATWAEQSFIDEDADPVEAAIVPFVRRLSGKVTDRSDQAQYYDRRDVLKQFSDEWKAVRADKENPERAVEWKAKYGAQASMFELNRSTENKLRDLRDDRRRIEARTGVPENMKRAKLKEIDAKINEAIDRFNKAYNNQIGQD